MVLRRSTLLLYAVSGLVSAAVAGFSLTMLLLAAAAGPFGLLLGLFLGFAGAWPALKVAGMPAILLGGALWTAGATRGWARNPALWAAIGAFAGLACYAAALLLPVAEMRDAVEISRLEPIGLASMFAIAGAGAALMFRQTMRVLLLFVPAGPRS